MKEPNRERDSHRGTKVTSLNCLLRNGDQAQLLQLSSRLVVPLTRPRLELCSVLEAEAEELNDVAQPLMELSK
jgi:hypothetical protein